MTIERVTAVLDGVETEKALINPVNFAELSTGWPETSPAGLRFLAGLDRKVVEGLSTLDPDELNNLVVRHLEILDDDASIAEHKDWLVAYTATRLSRLVERFVAGGDADTPPSKFVSIPVVDDNYVQWSKIEPRFRQAAAFSLAAIAGEDLQLIPQPAVGAESRVRIGQVSVSNTITPDVTGQAFLSEFKFTKR